MPLVRCATGPVVLNWSAPSAGALIGDSQTVVINGDATALAVLTAGGRTITNLAVNGHTIAQQLVVWQATSSVAKHAFTWASVLIGGNDIAAGKSALDTYAEWRAFLAALESAAPQMRIMPSVYFPAKGYVGLSAGEWVEWQAMNVMILAYASQRYRICSAHYAILDDGLGNLAAPYDSGDHLHINSAGALAVAQQWRARLDAAA